MLEKIFIKNYDKTNDPSVRVKYAVLCSVLGIVSNILLSVFKMIIGFLSGSISIIADGIDNLTDCASNVATLVGFKLSSLPADPEHPFGHERIEYLTGILISILIIMVGVMLGRSSIENIINKASINIGNFIFLIVVLLGSIFVKFVQFLYYRKIAKKIDSPTIKTSSQDSLNDCIKTIFVLVSILLFKYYEINLDNWFGLIMSIYIVINGIKLIRETSSPLIGEAPSEEFTNMIKEKLVTYEGVLGIHDLVIHNYGHNKKFITVHVEVDSSNDILESHDMIDNIEREFKEDLNLDLTIHMDPIETRDELTNILKGDVLDVILKSNSKIHFHDFRIVRGNTHINILFDIVVPIKFDKKDEEIKDEIIKNVKEKCESRVGKTVNVIITVDRNYI